MAGPARGFFAFAVTVCCAAGMIGTVPAAARDKKLPVPQWGLDAAKTPTPAYAKDAGSVVLFDEYLETVDDQGRAVEREREAIRILAVQGRQTACGTSYDVDEKIDYFNEWTVTASGQAFQAKEMDFTEVGDTSIPIMLSTERMRIVHPPAADVGATVICESEELMAPYIQEKEWQVQSSIPVVFEALEVDLPPGAAHAESWHQYPPVKGVEVAPNHWRWELHDVHRLDLRYVKAHPAWEALAGRMTVLWGKAAVTGTGNEWRALGMWYTDLEAHRADPTPAITAEAEQLTAGAPDFYTKLRKITEYLQKNVQYFVVERGIGGLQSHFAGDVFRNGYGDCKDKSTLLISMLGAIGIEADYVALDDRRGVVDPNSPSLYGNHMIAAIEIPAGVEDSRLQAVVKANDGKRYLLFDPTDERTPVGNLPSDLQGGYGMLAAGPASQVIALPVLPPADNGDDRTGTFTLAPDGTLTGAVDASRFGPEGADYRWLVKLTNEKERSDTMATLVARDLPGATLDSFQFVLPPDLSKPMELDYKVTVPEFAHAAGTLLLVRPRVVGEDATPLGDEPRTAPIDLDATGRWRDCFDITLPAGYTVDETPDPANVDVGFASYRSATTVKGNVLHYEREYIVRQVEIPASAAPEFKKLEDAIVEDERGMAVLKKQ